MMKIMTPLLALTLALASTVADAQVPAPTRPTWFSMPNTKELRKSTKKVFAHYIPSFLLRLDNQPVDQDYYTTHYLNPDGEDGKWKSVGGFIRERPLPVPGAGQPIAGNPKATWVLDDAKTEVRRAIMAGIDGFDYDGLDVNGEMWERFLVMLKAANAVDPNFKILFKPDMFAGLSQNPDALYGALMQIKNSPALLRLPDGRIVVSPYGADALPVSFWKKILARWAASGVRVAFVPCVQQWKQYANAFAPISYGMMQWGQDQSMGFKYIKKQTGLSLFCNCVNPQYFRPNAKIYDEYNNSESFRLNWENLIKNDVDWINVVTWNDYAEGTEIAPSTGIGNTFFELTAYYSTWFKTGVQPTISKDRIFMFHHAEISGKNLNNLISVDASPVAMAATATAVMTALEDRVEFTGYGQTKDDLEVVAFLVAPGAVQVRTGTQTYQFNGVTGQNVFRVPTQLGSADVTLNRGLTNVYAASPITVRIPGKYPDLLYRGTVFGNS